MSSPDAQRIGIAIGTGAVIIGGMDIVATSSTASGSSTTRDSIRTDYWYPYGYGYGYYGSAYYPYDYDAGVYEGDGADYSSQGGYRLIGCHIRIPQSPQSRSS